MELKDYSFSDIKKEYESRKQNKVTEIVMELNAGIKTLISLGYKPTSSCNTDVFLTEFYYRPSASDIVWYDDEEEEY